LGIFTLDIRKDRAIWENRRIYEIMGRKREAGAIGMAEFLRDFVHPADAAGLEAQFQAAIESGQALRFSYRIRRQNDGAVRWVETFGTIEGTHEKDADGTPATMVGVVADITERKQAELALKETAERLRIATAAAQLGVLHFDIREGRMYWENSRMYEIFGRDPEAGPPGREELFAEIIHAGDAGRVRQRASEAVRKGGAFHEVCRIRRRDGALRWIEFHAQAEVDAEGRPVRLTGVAADTTDRVEREQYTRSILDSLQTFVGVLSPEGVLLDVNRAALEAAAIPRSEVVGKSTAQRFFWSYSSDAQNRIQEAIDRARAGVSSRFDIQARMKDGQLMTLDWMISPLRDQDGEVKSLIASAISIDERKQVEAALRESEERYRLAEWATNDGLWDWTPGNNDYCYFSPQFNALLGLQEGELESRAGAIFERLHPEDEPRLQEAVRLNWEQRKPYALEIRLRMRDGSYRWFRTRGEAVRDAAGRVVRMTGAITDIHDQKEVQALSRSQDEQLRLMMVTSSGATGVGTNTRERRRNRWRAGDGRGCTTRRSCPK
jgi:PAS domain S-box-containing protein